MNCLCIYHTAASRSHVSWIRQAWSCGMPFIAPCRTCKLQMASCLSVTLQEGRKVLTLPLLVHCNQLVCSVRARCDSKPLFMMCLFCAGWHAPMYMIIAITAGSLQDYISFTSMPACCVCFALFYSFTNPRQHSSLLPASWLALQRLVCR